VTPGSESPVTVSIRGHHRGSCQDAPAHLEVGGRRPEFQTDNTLPKGIAASYIAAYHALAIPDKADQRCPHGYVAG
jgi:hypothetical protein